MKKNVDELILRLLDIDEEKILITGTAEARIYHSFNTVTSLVYAMTVGNVVDIRRGGLRKFRRE